MPRRFVNSSVFLRGIAPLMLLSAVSLAGPAVDRLPLHASAARAHTQAHVAAQSAGQQAVYTLPAPPFEEVYRRQDGIRVLSYPRSWLLTADDVYSQYFEKGRIEWHPEVRNNPAWRFAYARLAADLIRARRCRSVETRPALSMPASGLQRSRRRVKRRHVPA
jgi:hypothetical protein